MHIQAPQIHDIARRAKAAGKVGELVGSHILARPHEDLMKVFVNESGKK
jgi:microcompartment protein CcmL/EutN